ARPPQLSEERGRAVHADEVEREAVLLRPAEDPGRPPPRADQARSAVLELEDPRALVAAVLEHEDAIAGGGHVLGAGVELDRERAAPRGHADGAAAMGHHARLHRLGDAAADQRAPRREREWRAARLAARPEVGEPHGRAPRREAPPGA